MLSRGEQSPKECNIFGFGSAAKDFPITWNFAVVRNGLLSQTTSWTALFNDQHEYCFPPKRKILFSSPIFRFENLKGQFLRTRDIEPNEKLAGKHKQRCAFWSWSPSKYGPGIINRGTSGIVVFFSGQLIQINGTVTSLVENPCGFFNERSEFNLWTNRPTTSQALLVNPNGSETQA